MKPQHLWKMSVSDLMTNTFQWPFVCCLTAMEPRWLRGFESSTVAGQEDLFSKRDFSLSTSRPGSRRWLTRWVVLQSMLSMKLWICSFSLVHLLCLFDWKKHFGFQGQNHNKARRWKLDGQISVSFIVSIPLEHFVQGSILWNWTWIWVTKPKDWNKRHGKKKELHHCFALFFLIGTKQPCLWRHDKTHTVHSVRSLPTLLYAVTLPTWPWILDNKIFFWTFI